MCACVCWASRLCAAPCFCGSGSRANERESRAELTPSARRQPTTTSRQLFPDLRAVAPDPVCAPCSTASGTIRSLARGGRDESPAVAAHHARLTPAWARPVDAAPRRCLSAPIELTLVRADAHCLACPAPGWPNSVCRHLGSTRLRPRTRGLHRKRSCKSVVASRTKPSRPLSRALISSGGGELSLAAVASVLAPHLSVGPLALSQLLRTYAPPLVDTKLGHRKSSSAVPLKRQK